MTYSDIKLENTGKWAIVEGDFAVLNDSATQTVQTILTAQKGDYKLDLGLGANLIEMLNSNATDAQIADRIRSQLELYGGFSNVKTKVEKGQINILNYER